jgi:RES domain-containing protein
MQRGEKWDGIALLDAFFAEEFIERARSQADYRVTSAFCDILRKEYGSGARLDAIMYPSVAFRTGFNVAIIPEAEKGKLQLLPGETKLIRVTDVLGYGMYQCETLFTLSRVREDGSLDWKPVP